jgi:uncharacterized protein YggE
MGRRIYMTRIAPLVTSLFLAVSIAAAQTPNTIQAAGSATRSVKPDMAQLNIGVVTQAATAQAAADQNATLTDAVIKALEKVLGSAGTIQTLYYSISPRYTNTQPATLVGYTVNNTVQVTTTNVSLVGPLIDAGNAAGANSVSGPYFGLQNSDPEVQLALAAASKQALAHASAIASGLGARVGLVISAQEGSTVRPVLEGSAGGLASAVSTPIQTGTVTVSANVTVSVALLQ